MEFSDCMTEWEDETTIHIEYRETKENPEMPPELWDKLVEFTEKLFQNNLDKIDDFNLSGELLGMKVYLKEPVNNI